MSGNFPNITPSDRRLVGLPIIGFPSAATPLLQYNETLNAFEWVAGGGGTTSDLEFLQAREDAGELLFASTNMTNPGTNQELISVTPANGVTFYHVESTITIGSNAAAQTWVMALQNDNVDVERFAYVLATGANQLHMKSTVKLDKMIGDGIKKYRLINYNAMITTTLVSGTIFGYIR